MSMQAALEHFSVAEQKAISSLPESLDFTEQLKKQTLQESHRQLENWQDQVFMEC